MTEQESREAFDKLHTRYTAGFRVSSKWNEIEKAAAWEAWQAAIAHAESKQTKRDGEIAAVLNAFCRMSDDGKIRGFDKILEIWSRK